MDNLIDNYTEDDNPTSLYDEMDIPLIIHNTHNDHHHHHHHQQQRQNGSCNNNNNNNNNIICQTDQIGFDSARTTYSINNSDDSIKTAKLKLTLVIILCFIFMITEFVGGYFAKSLAIMSDAAHLMSDCLTFFISLLAISLSKKSSDKRMSFGYKRIEILAVLFSILVIWLLTILLCYFAIERIYTKDFNIEGKTMMYISIIGIIINISMAFTLHGPINISHSHSHHHHHNNNSNSSAKTTASSNNKDLNLIPNIKPNNLSTYHHNGNNCNDENNYFNLNSSNTKNETNVNIKAAMLHILGDFIQSIGVFIASIIIQCWPNAKIADPLCTLIFSIIVILTTVKLFKESILIILNSVPQTISIDNLKSDLLRIDGVKSVHHLNVWNHSVNYSLMMVHLNIDDFTNNEVILEYASILARDKYKIQHSTIQIERQPIKLSRII